MPPHLRHQSSLEDVLYFSLRAPTELPQTERTTARHTFYRIVDHFTDRETAAAADHQSQSTGESQNWRQCTYSKAGLIRYTYEYAISDLSKDIYLRAFFQSLALELDTDATALDFDEIAPLVAAFAGYLMESFFLPLKSSTQKTPQPSPLSHSAVMAALGDGNAAQGFVGTEDRLATLRSACLVRDRHRCVITRRFDVSESVSRYKKHGGDARDDDGVLLVEQGHMNCDKLEVAHILPHALMKPNANSELDKSREAALAVLNMFDYGITHLIEGVEIDRPTNAITLTALHHSRFGMFEIFFEAVDGAVPNTYVIQTFLPYLNGTLGLPVTRTLFITDTRTIDPPLPRLLALHSAIGHILHLSGAGDYIDQVLRDMETNLIRADGTSELGHLVSLRLGGWIDGRVY